MSTAGGGRTTYAYDLNANNRMSTEWSGTTTNTNTYDSNGNTTLKAVSGGGTTTYAYSDLDRLTSVRYPSGSTSSVYAYNGAGTRVKKVDTDGTATYFIYDGTDAIMELDSSGNATAKYWYGPDGLVWMNKNLTNLYVACDHLGSVWNTVTLDSAETIKGTYTYTAFGDTTASETIANNFRYAGALGYYNDPESGMMLLGARYYSSGAGRFLTSDPVRDGRNWYMYVSDNPVVYSDANGLAPKFCPGPWNNARYHNNCYSYARNRMNPPVGPPTKPQPGDGSGHKFDNAPCGKSSCNNIMANARNDGMTDVPKGGCPKGWHKVLLFVDTDGDAGYDYHWYRQDCDGRWSHKPGWLPVIGPIDDPNGDASGRGYDKKCGALCAKD